MDFREGEQIKAAMGTLINWFDLIKVNTKRTLKLVGNYL